MNKKKMDIVNALYKKPYINQRLLAEETGYSLGKVNQFLKELQEDEYLDKQMSLTAKAFQYIESSRPANAVILAAGFGMRMVPINTETPKGLLTVRGETLIERLIVQLQEAGIRMITIVVGFMKEAYEYLIDQYQVELCVNMEYAQKNNLHSLRLAADRICDTYIVPCDIWCEKNPFRKTEMYSWYMVCDIMDDDSDVRVNRKEELVRTSSGGNQMIGIAYISREDAPLLCRRLKEMDERRQYDNCFWEEALFEKDRMYLMARMISGSGVFEINTYEQLRELDSRSDQLRTESMEVIAETFGVQQEEIRDITVLKKGMTNRSFLFTCRDQRYIMRIPGEGTERLINRREEYEVYQKIKDTGLCDDIFYLNPENGYKITAYFESVRVCDAQDAEDVRRCMEKLRGFHQMGLETAHSFDIFGQIEFYESLWDGQPSCYRDYQKTKEAVFQLKEYIDAQPIHRVLTHIDAVPDNFLFVRRGEEEEVRIIDWEYAGMQDPCVDIAMFAIYAMYNREETDRLIDLYYPAGCERACRLKIYCYVAACGLLWSNWCEYKRQLGVEFGEYSLRQYRYAKEYSRIFQREKEDGGRD